MKDQLEAFRRYFSEQQFWLKLAGYARKAGIKVVYSALLLYYAYRRKETPGWAKRIILGSLGYFLSPIDLIPDLSPVIGYTDDMAVLAFGITAVAIYINNDVKARALGQLSKWFGGVDEKEIT